jgi:hypothetical protein
MAAKPFIVAPQDYAPALNIVGEHFTASSSLLLCWIVVLGVYAGKRSMF